jgi:cyclic pyranopterin phosphate synthase
LRLSTEGQLYTCLFAAQGTDIRALLRGGAEDALILNVLRKIWRDRDDRYSEIRSAATAELPRIEMSYIGG